jgi:hypothetical protein
MNARIFAILLLMAALGAAALLLPPRAAQSQVGIVLENADGRRDVAMVSDAGLQGNVNAVAQRISLEFANSSRVEALQPLPVGMHGLLEQAAAHISVQFANGLRTIPLAGLPGPMLAGVDAVAARLVLDSAGGRRDVALAYPRTLLNDTTPPQISGIAAQWTGANTRLRWRTDEFTRATVQFGEQPGAYTGSATEPYFAREHELQLPPVQPGGRLYFRITVVDLSDNQASSDEQVVIGQRYLYLPSLRR